MRSTEAKLGDQQPSLTDLTSTLEEGFGLQWRSFRIEEKRIDSAPTEEEMGRERGKNRDLILETTG